MFWSISTDWTDRVRLCKGIIISDLLADGLGLVGTLSKVYLNLPSVQFSWIESLAYDKTPFEPHCKHVCFSCNVRHFNIPLCEDWLAFGASHKWPAKELQLSTILHWLPFKALLRKEKRHSGIRYHLSNTCNNLHISFNDWSSLEKVEVYKYLSVWLDPELSFGTHIDYVAKNINCSLNILYRSINLFIFQVR